MSKKLHIYTFTCWDGNSVFRADQVLASVFAKDEESANQEIRKFISRENYELKEVQQ